MAEYIEREAAMLQIDAADFVRDDNFEGGATLLFCDDVVDRLSAIPAADVRPVVLCRDCVHYEMGVCLKIYDDGSANKDAWQERKPDDYCSYGEDRNVPTKESEEVSAVRCWLTNGADMRPTSMSGANGEES